MTVVKMKLKEKKNQNKMRKQKIIKGNILSLCLVFRINRIDSVG